MSRRLNCFGILLCLFLASEVQALGLGDIRLDSALNEPLRAEIELLSATPEELESLRVGLASAETFERYGIDRPVFLTTLDFDVVARGGSQVVSIRSPEPVTEPFVTFLVEANWSRGRLLREYTVLLDPPTFAPPPATSTTEAVTAPRQTQQADRGRIERPAPAPTPAARAPADSGPAFDTTAGDDYRVARGDTLWRIAERVRPDERLSMNQTMLAIYEANPEAFAGNINVLRANARLRIPSADEIFRIGRGQALSEIRRQNQAWSGAAPAPQTTLTLVPPDGEQQPYEGGTPGEPGTAPGSAAADRIRTLEERIAEQESLLEIRDNELARLRSELAWLREERGEAAAGRPAEPPAEAEPTEPVAADDEGVAAEDEIFVEDEPAVADTGAEAEPAEAAPEQPARPAPRVAPAPEPEPGLVDRIIGLLTGFWGIVGAALLAVLGLLVWFARRASRDSEDADTGVWDALDADADADAESVQSTERLRALARDDDESIVVVEQDKRDDTVAGDTLETLAADDASGDISAPEPPAEAPVSLEDTFSSETAINLDQSDPVAEADFHMAYGLYDQAADLINGALAIEPQRTDLMAKLCEIYFVWGNRDAFVDAAGRLKAALSEDPDGDWDKIVIMGQQIAADHELFAGAGVGGAATQAVDLDFEGGSEASSALDIDFAGDDAGSEVIDLGDDDGGTSAAAADDDALDFSFDEDDTGASITREMPESVGSDDPTVETPTISERAMDDTLESPTVEQPFDSLDSTSELPLMSDAADGDDARAADSTAEIDLDDLGLDLDALAGDLGDDDLLGEDDATGTDLPDELAETGRNKQVDDDLLDATGQTQVLPEDFTVETGTNLEKPLADDEATMMAPGLGSDADFDFAKTEALPKDAFDDDSDATAETPAPGTTDMDLDLDDLTAALKLSEAGDTIEQLRDDKTVEQPRIGGEDTGDLDLDLGLGEEPTQQLGPDDVSDDLREARTMTEVGTKLDLARAYVDMGDPGGARNILEEVLEEGDESQRQQAQQLLDSLPG